MLYDPDAERRKDGHYDFDSSLDAQYHTDGYCRFDSGCDSGPIYPRSSPTRRLGDRPKVYPNYSHRTSSPTSSATRRRENGPEEHSKPSSRTSALASSTTSRLGYGLEECPITSNRMSTAQCLQGANIKLPNRQEMDIDSTGRQSASRSQRDASTQLYEPDDFAEEKAQLQTLPSEIIHMLLFHLEPSDQVSLCLANKHLYEFSRDGLKVLMRDHEQRLKLFRVLDRDLPDHRFCSGCSKFHKRQIESEEPFPCITYQAYSRCMEANIPLFHGIYLSWPSTQLALRPLYYESWEYGCAVETSGNIRQLANTYDNVEKLTWINQLCWSRKDGGITITLHSLRQWLAQTRIEPNQCRGLLMKLSWADAARSQTSLPNELLIWEGTTTGQQTQLNPVGIHHQHRLRLDLGGVVARLINRPQTMTHSTRTQACPDVTGVSCRKKDGGKAMEHGQPGSGVPGRASLRTATRIWSYLDMRPLFGSQIRPRYAGVKWNHPLFN